MSVLDMLYQAIQRLRVRRPTPSSLFTHFEATIIEESFQLKPPDLLACWRVGVLDPRYRRPIFCEDKRVPEDGMALEFPSCHWLVVTPSGSTKSDLTIWRFVWVGDQAKMISSANKKGFFWGVTAFMHAWDDLFSFILLLTPYWLYIFLPSSCLLPCNISPATATRWGIYIRLW